MNKEITLQQALPLIEEILSNDGEVAFSPAGTSMMPLLRNRQDKIILNKPNGKLKKFDVPLYRRHDGAFVLHRVVAINNDGYVMCGDNQTLKEYSVKDDQIIAVMKAFYRNGKLIDCNDFLYRLYSSFWTTFLPCRPLFRRIISLPGRIRRKFCEKN